MSPGEDQGALVLKLAVWALLGFGLAGLVVLKAVMALRAGRRYRFTFLDGGLLFRGKETSPGMMVGIAAVYALGMSALVAWPLGFYQSMGDRTSSACRDVMTMEDLRRVAGGAIEEPRVLDLSTMCLLQASGVDHAPMLDLEIRGYGTGGDPRGSVVMTAKNGVPIRRLDAQGSTTLWLDGRRGGVMSVLLFGGARDDKTREIAELMSTHQDLVDRFAAKWRTPRSSVLDVARRNPIWVFVALGGVLVAGVVVARVLRARAFRRALELD